MKYNTGGCNERKVACTVQVKLSDFHTIFTLTFDELKLIVRFLWVFHEERGDMSERNM
jgi:hypothetical protein